MTRVLITGLSGFTGAYVASQLDRRGIEYFDLDGGTARSDQYRTDISDFDLVAKSVRRLRPTHCLHFAAISSVTGNDFRRIYDINVSATKNLLNALVDTGTTERVVLPSTAYVYRPSPTPHSEDSEILPSNEYAVSKLAMEYSALLLSNVIGITVTRPFNYIGVGQSANFVVPKIIEQARTGNFELGDTTAVREFTDVRDVARIYAELLFAPDASGVLNISSGRGHSVGEVVRQAQSLSGIDRPVTSKCELLRPGEASILMGQNQKLIECIGPQSFRPLSETLKWMYESSAELPISD